ncbi:MAG TPA: (d)CMP kinase [Candidatus Binataceae bacterium]|jgi:cytidylate kinase
MKRARPIVAIDGPVGAGKSTVARALAKALGFSYLNTGAIYRAVAVAARAAGIRPDFVDASDASKLNEQLTPILDSIAITFKGERVMLAGHDISDVIIEPEIGDLASRLSALPLVREKLLEVQRAAGIAGGVVMEGRDIGTAIFPDAEVKFFLVADPAVRAERRYAELAAKGVATTLAEVAAQLADRDRRDAGRAVAPLKPAADAIMIDSTIRDVDTVVNEMKTRVEAVSRAV